MAAREEEVEELHRKDTISRPSLSVAIAFVSLSSFAVLSELEDETRFCEMSFVSHAFLELSRFRPRISDSFSVKQQMFEAVHNLCTTSTTASTHDHHCTSKMAADQGLEPDYPCSNVRDLSSRYKHVTDFYWSLFGNVAYRKGEAAEDVGFERRPVRRSRRRPRRRRHWLPGARRSRRRVLRVHTWRVEAPLLPEHAAVLAVDGR